MQYAKPVIVWIVVVMLAADGLYSAYAALANHSWWLATAAALALTAACAIVFTTRRLEWLVYACLLAPAVIYVYHNVTFFIEKGLPYPDTLRNLIATVPGVLLLTFCIGATIVVRRHFRHVHPV